MRTIQTRNSGLSLVSTTRLAPVLRAVVWLLLVVALAAVADGARAATYVSRANGNWNATGTWAELRTGTITTSTASPTVTGVGTTFTTQLAVGNVLYRADGAAIGTVQSITNNTTLILTGNAASTNSGIPYYRGATATPIAGDTVTVNSPNTVTVSAAAASTNLTVNSGGTLTQTARTLTLSGTLSVAGTHTCGNTVTVTGLTTVSGLLNITATTGTKNFNGGVTINPGGTFRNNTVAEPVTIRANFLNSGTFTSGTGTYTFSTTAGQWGGSNPIAFGGAVTVSAARTVNTPVSVTGTLAISGAVTVTNNSTVTASGAITGTVAGSTWTNAANSTLNVSGALLATGTLNASASGNTVHYDGAGAQAVKLAAGGNYHHLTASGGNTKTPAAGTHNIAGNLTVGTGTIFNANTSDPTINVTGNVTIAGTYTASNNAGRPLTIGGNLVLTGTYTGNSAPVNLAGNFTDSGTFTSGAGVFTFNGTAAQTLDGTTAETSITNVVMNNTAALAADRSLTLNHALRAVTTLALTSGRIVTGANKVVFPNSGGAITGAGANNFIAGRLEMVVPTGPGSTVFPVGTDSAGLAYTPAAFNFPGGVGGSLLVYVVLGDHPQIATSTLDATKSVNRYWVATTSGVGGTPLDPTKVYDATFTFINTDVDSGANPLNFEIERYDSATWFTPTAGTRTSTTTQVLGAAGLGDFAIAEKKVIIPPPGDFNAFETTTAGGAITGRIFTKLVGTNFALDVVAILSGAQHATFTNTVQVDLVTGSTGGLNCPGTPATIAGTTQSVNLTAGRGTTGNFNVASAYPNVRVRVRYPVASPTVTSCSTDNFAIRPTAFTVTSSNATQTDSSGAPAIKTGANFNLTAASVAGYDGTPSVDSTKVVGTPVAGTIGGSFGAAPVVTGTAVGNAFFYSEVGNFGLNANAVYDSSFTSVDQAGGDCTADFSNTLVGGKYGCSFGSTAIAQITGSSGFGRFIPDNFNVIYTTQPVFATSCGSFGYVGNSFTHTVTPVLTVTARQGISNGLTNLTTTNYAGAYAKLTNASLSQVPYDTQAGRYSRFDALGGGATPALDTTGSPATAGDPAIAAFVNGVSALSFAAHTLTFTRSATTPNAPFDADIALALNVIDTDGVAFAANPASFGAASAGNGIAFNTGKPMRYGRLAIRNANGSQLVPLQIRIEAQHWAGAPSNAFITNIADSCTTIAASDIAMSGYTNNLSGSPLCETAVSGGGVLSAGRRTLLLAAPGSGNNGSVTLTVNLGSSASGNTCATVGAAPGPATTANRPHLQGKWSGAAYDQNPAARATFGVYRGSEEVIHIREMY